MGNALTLDESCLKPDDKRKLDLSNKVTRQDYLRHRAGVATGLSSLPLPSPPPPISSDDSTPPVTPIESLSVAFHSISEIPRDLPLRLPHLTELDLSHNSLTHLPGTLSLLLHLRSARLSHNQLRDLPMSIVHLAHLRLLDLSHNRLVTLPETMGRMESLQRLNLTRNDLTRLPISLGRCTTLVVCLAVRNTRMNFPPADVCNRGSAATLRALREAVYDGREMDAISESSKNEFPRLRSAFLASASGLTTNANASLLEAWYSEAQAFPDRVKCPLMAPMEASTLGALELRDRILGMLYGAAIGDGIGMATEGMPNDYAEFYYGVAGEELGFGAILRDGYRTQWVPGDWTTHFDQLILCLDSLIDWTGVVDELDFARRLHGWMANGFPELGDTEGFEFSGLQSRVVSENEFLTSPHEAARSVSTAMKSSDNAKESAAACDDSAVVRSLIQGVPHFHNPPEVIENAARICRATHSGSCAVLASGFISASVAYILQGKVNSSTQLKDCLPSIMKQLKANNCCQDNELWQEFDDLMTDNCEPPKEAHVGSCAVLLTLQKAVSAVHRHTNYREAVTDVVMEGGHCNAVSALTGGLMGCLCGYSNLPSDWLGQLLPQQIAWLNTKLNHLLDMMGVP